MMDRATGEVLSAEPFVHITTTRGVDLATGALAVRAGRRSRRLGEVVRDICPASPGGKDWQPSSFSPRTGLLYIPHQNLCEDEEGIEANYIAGTPYVGMNVQHARRPRRPSRRAHRVGSGRRRAGVEDHRGASRSGAARSSPRATSCSTARWTAGSRRSTRATAQPLWQFKTGSGIIGQPVTYRGPDGKQYVAVMSGVGGWAGAIVAGDLDPRDSTAALGFAAAMTDLPGEDDTREARCTCSRCHEQRRCVDRALAARRALRRRVALARVSLAACKREERRFRESPPSATPSDVVRVSALQPGAPVDTTHVAEPVREQRVRACPRGSGSSAGTTAPAVTPTAAAAWARR